MKVLFALEHESAKAMSAESTDDLSSSNKFFLSSIVCKAIVIVSPTSALIIPFEGNDNL